MSLSDELDSSLIIVGFSRFPHLHSVWSNRKKVRIRNRVINKNGDNQFTKSIQFSYDTENQKIISSIDNLAIKQAVEDEEY